MIIAKEFSFLIELKFLNFSLKEEFNACNYLNIIFDSRCIYFLLKHVEKTPKQLTFFIISLTKLIEHYLIL